MKQGFVKAHPSWLLLVGFLVACNQQPPVAVNANNP